MAWEENSRICLHMQLIAFYPELGSIMHLTASSQETASSRLSNADGFISRMAPKIGTAVCGTARTVV